MSASEIDSANFSGMIHFPQLTMSLIKLRGSKRAGLKVKTILM